MTSKIKQNKWVVMFAMLFAGICFAMNNYKVPPNMLNISQTLDVSFTLVGNLMTVGGLCGVIMTLPGGALVKRFGPRRIGIVGACCTLFGGIVSVLCSNIYIMLVSRFVEAIGFCLCPTVGMTIISAWFPPEKRGLPNGLWTCWISIGMLTMMNLSSPLTASFNYYGSFWLAVVMMALALIALVVFVRTPDGAAQAARSAGPVSDPSKTTAKVSSLSVYKTPAIWFLALAFLCFAFLNQCFAGFYTSYMQIALGMPAAEANAATSAVSIGGIVAAIVVGLALNRIPGKHQPTVLMVLTFFAAIVAILLFRQNDPNTIVAFTVISGFVVYMIPATVFNIAPTIPSNPVLIPIALAIVNFAQNVSGALNGFLISPMINQIISSGSADWSEPANLLIIVAAGLVIGGVGQCVLIKRMRAKRSRQGE